MPEKFANGHALLIGVGKDLPVTVEDATVLRDILVDPKRAAYPPAQVQLLTEAKASQLSILAAFDELIARARETSQATVLIYFSGHGGRIPDRDSFEYFLVPYDFDPQNREQTAIAGSELTEKIEQIEAEKVVVFLDCCHAGGIKDTGENFVKSPPPSDLLAELAKGSGRVVITSSRAEEKSYTGTPYSIFTACLVEALAGQASVAKDGYARILDILIYLFEQVPKRAAERQHPYVQKMLDLGDNFPLCYYAGGGKDISVSASTRPDSGQRRRLQQRREGIQSEWDIRSEKIKRMRSQLAIEASLTTQFQLEKELLREEARLAELDRDLDAIDANLE